MHAKTSRAVSHLLSGRAPTASGSHESMPSWELEPENLEFFENSIFENFKFFIIGLRFCGLLVSHNTSNRSREAFACMQDTLGARREAL